VEPRLVPAPLWRRFVAALIDGAVYSPLWLVPAGSLVLVQTRRAMSGRPVPEAGKKSVWQRTFSVAVAGALTTIQLGRRNAVSPGKRRMGLRRVDAQTGGPVTARQVVTNRVAEHLWGATCTAIVRPLAERTQAELKGMQPQMHEIQRAHRDDKEAQQAAMQALYNENNVNPLATCLPLLAGGLVMPATALLSPRRQSLISRLAGIAVVYEPPGTD
jgi:uncharacterized RDD family membrane protein YckC